MFHFTPFRPAMRIIPASSDAPKRSHRHSGQPAASARVTPLTWDDTSDAASVTLSQADALVRGTLTRADASKPGTLPLSKLGTLPLSRPGTVTSSPASSPQRYAVRLVRHV